MRGSLVALCLGFALALPGAASAQCYGTVHGLSANYDPYKGSGFLAVRNGPGSSYAKIGELFNGYQVTINGRQGSWYQIWYAGIGNGWSHRKWISTNCY